MKLRFLPILAVLCAWVAGLAQSGPAPFGHGLGFNGVDNYVAVAFDSPPATDYTIGAWIFLHTGGSYGGTRVAVLSSTTCGASVELLVHSKTGNPADPQYLELGRCNGFNGEPSTTPVPLDTWTHVAVTVAADKTVSYFINGRPAGTWSGDGKDLGLGTAVNLGDNSSVRRFDGVLDEVQIWKRALSAAEIWAGWKHDLDGGEDGLYAYYRFAESQGTTTGDGAPLGGVADGTLVKSPGRTQVTYVVTNTNDEGPGSLRDATVTSGNGVIVSFSRDLSGKTIVLTHGALVLDQSLSIDASGLPGGIAIDGNGASRIFEILASATVVFDSLTLTNGRANAGGAILNGGTLTATRCAVVGNSAAGGGGGGIYNNLGGLTLNQCTIAANSAVAGGGIFNLSGGAPVVLNQCTVSGNSASTGGGVDSFGLGAITVSFFNSIVAGNTTTSGPDVHNTAPTLFGSNIIAGDPRLEPLGLYGGPTPVLPPRADSPAIDAGDDSAVGAPYWFVTDQLGQSRRAGSHVDIGSSELEQRFVVTADDFGPGSLRDAIMSLSTLGLVRFGTNLSGTTIVMTSGELVLDQKLISIDAMTLPKGLTLSGGDAGRIFNVKSGGLVLSGLTLAHGNASGGSGGAIYSAPGSSLGIERCAFSLNSALEGGAILNDGLLRMENSTFSGNSGGYGGALQCRGPSTLVHCTISGNAAQNGGGGIFNKGSSLTLNNCIVAGNTPVVAGADIYNQLAKLVYANANLVGIYFEDRANVAGPPPLVGDPLLAPFGDYGFPTPTMPLTGLSPAIDAGGPTTLSTDQRGHPRVIGATPDLGAVEFEELVVLNTADDGVGSLRHAIAHVAPGSNITFDPSLSGRTITLTGGPLPVTNSVAIDASALADGLVISGNKKSGILSIHNNPVVGLYGLTLVDAFADSGQGAAIYSSGTLTLDRCTLSGHRVGNEGAAGLGGAIYNDGSLTILRTTFSMNTVDGAGGAIFNQGTLLMSACTLWGNQATSPGFSVDPGGAIFNKGNATLRHCTISGNLAAYQGGGIYNRGILTLNDCIVAGNAPDDIHGTYFGFHDLVGVDPLLAPLGNYGGRTKTMALLPGSPARNAATVGPVTADQRGFPIVGLPDIGAYEAGTRDNFDAWIWETLLPATGDHGSSADPDGDGISNHDEWLANTNPGVKNNPNDLVFDAAIARLGNGVSVSFPTVTNHYYFLRVADSLAGPWTDTGLPGVPGTGKPGAFAIPEADSLLRFFRIQAGP